MHPIPKRAPEDRPGLDTTGTLYVYRRGDAERYRLRVTLVTAGTSRRLRAGESCLCSFDVGPNPGPNGVRDLLDHLRDRLDLTWLPHGKERREAARIHRLVRRLLLGTGTGKSSGREVAGRLPASKPVNALPSAGGRRLLPPKRTR